MKKYRIKDYSYFTDVFFVVGKEQELIDYQKKTFNNDTEVRAFTGRMITVNPTERYILLPINGKQITIWEEVALTHEVLHLTFSILNNAGISYSLCQLSNSYVN